MCGIFGSNYKKLEDVERASKVMNNRGPDFNKIIKRGNFYLAHNRLSIQDLSSRSNQPYEYKDSVMVYNGELWNDQTIDFFNNTFETTGDVERFSKFLYCFDLHNLADINGMFAFAFLKDDILTLGRDIAGEIPLYYYHLKNKFVFASEIKAIKEFDDTIPLKEIKLFPPRTYAKLKGEELIFTQYYSFPNVILSDSEEELSLNFKDLLIQAVKTKVPSDVPYTVLLSGGIDSSILTYILHQINPNIEAFTISLDTYTKKVKSNDLHHAKVMANYLNIKLNAILINEVDVLSKINTAVEVIEDKSWTQISSAVPHLYLAEEIAKHGYKVVFSGSGADELFASYSTSKQWNYTKDADYDADRRKLINHLHKNNTIRENKCMMKFSQEIRAPFLEKNFIEYALNIDPKFRLGFDPKNPKQVKRMKPILRKAFAGLLPDEVLWREKVPEGEGVGIEEIVKLQKDNIIAHYKKVYK